MKKFLITITIVAIVIGAHVILLKQFIFPQKKKTGTEEVKPGDALDKDKIPPPADISPAVKTPALKPYIYKNATFGELAAIPDSKKATSGILVDLNTRQVIWAKNPKKAVAIASMTKMMTEFMVFEELATRKDVNLQTLIQVTPSAAKIGGSQIYLDPKEAFPLEDLLKAVMISSANDAAYLVAEYFGNGDVNAFVEKMNVRAKQLKLVGAKFYNPHGLPGDTAKEDNICSPEGLVMLAERLLDNPKAAEFARTKAATIRENTSKPFTLYTHNHLLGACQGVNGMKTGFIQRSGFCITVTCQRGDRKMAAAVTGFPTRKERDIFMAKLLEWGYKQQPKVASVEPDKIEAGSEDKNLEELLSKIIQK
jgi:D-alanyl-D-alanine carboxypeptidase (penicillin-binding protein 5/6)